MHRKRVTCELHDSYFRLLTIKHAIPKIEWAIEWAWNYYITQSRQTSDSWSWIKRRDVVGKATPGRWGPWGPWWVGVQRSCWEDVVKKASRVGPWASRWAALENEKGTTLSAIRVGGQYIAVLFGLKLPLTIKPWITFWNPYNKVRGIFFKEVFARRYSLRRYVSSIYMYYVFV